MQQTHMHCIFTYLNPLKSELHPLLQFLYRVYTPALLSQLSFVSCMWSCSRRASSQVNTTVCQTVVVDDNGSWRETYRTTIRRKIAAQISTPGTNNLWKFAFHRHRRETY